MSRGCHPQTSQTLALTLVLVGAAARLLPHPPNVTPVAAIALFGGACLPRRLAWWLPLAIMALTDALIGFHDVILFTWGGFALTTGLGLCCADAGGRDESSPPASRAPPCSSC